jgi:hypothetical protein
MVKVLLGLFIFIILSIYGQSSDETQATHSKFEFDPNGKLEGVMDYI